MPANGRSRGVALVLIGILLLPPPVAVAGAAETGDAGEFSQLTSASGCRPTCQAGRDGSDWPSFLGLRRDSTSLETGILTDWPVEGPRLVWHVEMGEGYATCSISRGRCLLFDRVEDQARLRCVHSETGQALWSFSYPTNYEDLYGYDGGPRCVPVVDGNRVYVFGAEGELHCVRLADGQLLWKLDTARRFGVVQNFFGVGSTPVIDGDLLLVMVGGSPPSSQRVPPGQLDRVQPNHSVIVAVNKQTGDVVYQVGDDLASYASIVTAERGGRRWAFAFARGGLLAIDPARGTQDFYFPWRARKLESVNASTPVIVGSEVFLSETYGPGSCVLQWREGRGKVIWQDRDDRREKAMQAHWNTPVYRDGFLYGSSGRHQNDAQLRCVAWHNGRVQWRRARFGSLLPAVGRRTPGLSG